MLRQLLQQQEEGKADRRLSIAAAQHVLGDDASALDWLEKALAEHSADLETLNSDAFWKDLRPHPRFQAILRKMNLVK